MVPTRPKRCRRFDKIQGSTFGTVVQLFENRNVHGRSCKTASNRNCTTTQGERNQGRTVITTFQQGRVRSEEVGGECSGCTRSRRSARAQEELDMLQQNDAIPNVTIEYIRKADQNED